MIPQNNWQSYPLPDDAPHRFRFGNLLLWAKTAHDEIWLDTRYLPNEEPYDPSLAEPAAEEFAWKRWTIPARSKEIVFRPLFPDLPVLVTPEYPFRMLPGVHTTIYVRVPVWVEILIGKYPVTAIPSVVLSKTWFGTFLEGELCYWISSGTRKAIEPDPERPFLAICPIFIKNDSEAELQEEKICLRVEQLELYAQAEQLYSNETRVTYRGIGSTSEVRTGRGAPRVAADAKRIAPARNPVDRSISARTFSTIKDFSGFGLFNR